MSGPYRVIQWATGNVGRYALRSILAHPELELAGLWVHDPAKVGRDAGEFAGGETTGVLATNDEAALLALDADIVCHTPLPSAQVGDDPDLDTRTLCRLLAAGKNVVTTVGYLYPKAHGPALVERLEAACTEGQSSLHGTGANPGFMAELVPLTLSAMSARIDRVVAREATEFSRYPSATIIGEMMGLGKPPCPPGESTAFARWVTGLFAESAHLVADGLGASLERLETDFEERLAEDDFEIAAGLVPKGSVAAQRYVWEGFVAGEPRIRLEAVYRARPGEAPDWGECGMVVRIEGRPRMELTLDETWMSNGILATAMHAVHALPAVCRAAPGIRTFLDLPLLTGRHTLAAS